MRTCIALKTSFSLKILFHHLYGIRITSSPSPVPEKYHLLSIDLYNFTDPRTKVFELKFNGATKCIMNRLDKQK